MQTQETELVQKGIPKSTNLFYVFGMKCNFWGAPFGEPHPESRGGGIGDSWRLMKDVYNSLASLASLQCTVHCRILHCPAMNGHDAQSEAFVDWCDSAGWFFSTVEKHCVHSVQCRMHTVHTVHTVQNAQSESLLIDMAKQVGNWSNHQRISSIKYRFSINSKVSITNQSSASEIK